MGEGRVVAQAADSYIDRKRWAWALSPIWICMPLMGMGLASITGAGAWNWLTLVIWYVVLPLVDLAIGSDANNPPESAVERSTEICITGS